MQLTVQNANDYSIPIGNHVATFLGLTTIETKKGSCYRWEFKTDKGQTVSGLSDATNPPTTKNKTGRWICALANQPIQSGVSIMPEHYVGQRYILIVTSDEQGKGKLETFSQMS